MSSAIHVPPGSSLNTVFADLAITFQREADAAAGRRARAEQSYAAAQSQPNSQGYYLAQYELRDARAHEANQLAHVRSLKSGVFRVGPGDSGNPAFMTAYSQVIAAASAQNRLSYDGGDGMGDQMTSDYVNNVQ